VDAKGSGRAQRELPRYKAGYWFFVTKSITLTSIVSRLLPATLDRYLAAAPGHVAFPNRSILSRARGEETLTTNG